MNGTSTSPLGTPLPPPSPWRLVRARNDKVAGVCAGLAAAAGIDVTIVRIAFVLAGLGGFGILIYLVLMFVVPKEDPAKGDVLQAAPGNVAQWIRIGLAVAGVFGLFSLADGSPPFVDDDGFGFGLGLCLLAIGAVVLWSRRGRPGWSSPGPNAAPPAPGASPMSMPTPSAGTWASPVPTATPTATTSWPQPAPDPAAPTAVNPHVPAPPPPYATDQRSRERVGGTVIAARVFGWLTVIATIPIAIAVGALVNVRALSLPWPYLSLVLAAGFVINLIVWSSIGRHVWQVIVAMTLPLSLGLMVAVASHWNGDIGERTERPATRAQIAPEYQMAIGHQVVDLSQLRVTGDPLTVKADHRIGLLEVVVPDNAAVHVDASGSAGVLAVFGVERDGSSIRYEITDGTSETSRIELELDLGYGRLEVCRASEADLVDGTLRCSRN